MNDPAEEGGGPAGVVEGLEAKELEAPKGLGRLFSEPGVEGASALDDSGTWKDIVYN